MANLSIVLADSTTVTVEQVALAPLSIVALSADMASMVELWELLSDTEKAATLEVLSDENVLAAFGNVTLTGTQTVYNNDGSMTVHYYMDYGQYGDEVSAATALDEILEVLSDDEE